MSKKIEKKQPILSYRNVYQEIVDNIINDQDDTTTQVDVNKINYHLFRAYDSTNDEGKIVINDMFETLTGYTFEDLRNQAQ